VRRTMRPDAHRIVPQEAKIFRAERDTGTANLPHSRRVWFQNLIAPVRGKCAETQQKRQGTSGRGLACPIAGCRRPQLAVTGPPGSQRPLQHFLPPDRRRGHCIGRSEQDPGYPSRLEDRMGVVEVVPPAVIEGYEDWIGRQRTYALSGSQNVLQAYRRVMALAEIQH